MGDDFISICCIGGGRLAPKIDDDGLVFWAGFLTADELSKQSSLFPRRRIPVGIHKEGSWAYFGASPATNAPFLRFLGVGAAGASFGFPGPRLLLLLLYPPFPGPEKVRRSGLNGTDSKSRNAGATDCLRGVIFRGEIRREE